MGTPLRISHFLDDVYNEDLGDNPPADDENIAPADYENITPADKEDTTPATQADTSSIRAEDEGTAPTNNQVTTQVMMKTALTQLSTKTMLQLTVQMPESC
ncbi:hypothetical protein LSTR_LSTR013375 [Laodelphax striatellus]|uniref:Uncharacterized protein n=1 Tax=Laodelphax striatellus TaxID=195883 RepID=A0A482WSK7_LAOST|nr:hypothetical protein LSTR_LSTR013375 [Laodelphax striatellus]